MAASEPIIFSVVRLNTGRCSSAETQYNTTYRHVHEAFNHSYQKGTKHTTLLFFFLIAKAKLPSIMKQNYFIRVPFFLISKLKQHNYKTITDSEYYFCSFA